jgi:hypothetical protein
LNIILLGSRSLAVDMSAVKFGGTRCLFLALGFVLSRLGEQPPVVACTRDNVTTNYEINLIMYSLSYNLVTT